MGVTMLDELIPLIVATAFISVGVYAIFQVFKR